MQSYLMVGAGGTGTHLLAPLVAYLTSHHADGEWMLYVMDGDTVEIKNLERQLFKDSDVTLNKAEAAVYPHDNGHVRALPYYLSEENIDRYIQDGDIVLICADNFTVRKRIEDKAKTLDNIAVINGGNEKYSGSVQLWVRAHGEDLTPRLSYLHPEVNDIGEDRAAMTCAQAAALPGGEQTIIANLQSATWMLTALWRMHSLLFIPYVGDDPKPRTWTELQFDAQEGTVEHIDQRMSSHWRSA
jgi:molybdopterin/thiamine biosynthesis adenylyltransferase